MSTDKSLTAHDLYIIQEALRQIKGPSEPIDCTDSSFDKGTYEFGSLGERHKGMPMNFEAMMYSTWPASSPGLIEALATQPGLFSLIQKFRRRKE